MAFFEKMWLFAFPIRPQATCPTNWLSRYTWYATMWDKPMNKHDGRVIAQENELRVLRALNRFGWLRTRDLAALLWQRWSQQPREAPDLKPAQPTASGLRMSQRTLRRLRGKRRVLSARAPDGSTIYALSEAGARSLNQLGIAAATGKDLLRSFSTAHFRHRCIANEIALGSIIKGFRVSTEREIARGLWLGGEEGIAGKKPDTLLRADGKVWWIEVERSRKNAKDYSRLLRWLDVVKRDASQNGPSSLLGQENRWGNVMFVCTLSFETKLCRDLGKRGWTKEQIYRHISFNNSLYNFKDIIFS
ncbi:hypothetical protein [Acidihalobacter prosperus]|uniref:hypothetical protein n=1 Tax=Acidihalobacter prosperus TaxID=160660 RepID=UPI00191C62C1|nr:hypothetical protein [Acidihalobacter prosperus]